MDSLYGSVSARYGSCRSFDDLRSQYFDIERRGIDQELDWNSVCPIKLLDSLGPAYKHLQERMRTRKDLKEDDVFAALENAHHAASIDK